MKVFTVGLDQVKPPPKESDTPPEKTGDSPPPGYSQPMPQMAMPIGGGPTYVVRKSRGYKGILLCMLAVFLMAVFALTLSEMAYNRHREENYFRLRWAELKHRLGYGRGSREHRGPYQGPFDYYGRSAYGPDRFFGNRNQQLADSLIEKTTTTTTAPPPPQPSIEEKEPPPSIFLHPQQQPGSFESRPIPPPFGDPSTMIRDARLRFLKQILQRIKQRAEAMGFDGTMQVSVIEVEPQVIDGSHPSQERPQPMPFPLSPFAHFPQSPFFGGGRPPLDPKSAAFLDGFGETHMPTLAQQNQFAERNQQEQNQQQPQPWSGNNVQEEPQADIFRPPQTQQQQQWQMIQPHQPPHIHLQRPPQAFDRWSSASGAGVPQPGSDNSAPQQPQQQNSQQSEQQQPEQPPPPPPMVVPLFPGQQQLQVKPFEVMGQQRGGNGPSQEVVGEMYGQKFGRMLHDIISNRIHGLQQLQQQPSPVSVQKIVSN